MISYQTVAPQRAAFEAPMMMPDVDGTIDHAEAYLASGLVSEAAELFSTLIGTPDALRAHMGLARCAYRLRQLHDALRHLQDVGALDPIYPDLANDMGVVLFELGMVQEAKEQFLRAATQQPLNPQPLRNLMDLAVRDDDWSECIRCAQQILALEPTDAEAREVMEAAMARAQSQQPAPPPLAAIPTPPASIMASEREHAIGSTLFCAPEEIVGVCVVPLTTEVDERGYITEALRATDPHFVKFGQIALVGNFRAGTIRAFARHQRTWIWYLVAHGTAKIVLRDERADSSTRGALQVIVTGERKQSIVAVPPGVYHGWASLADETQIVCVASEPYDLQQPDEEIVADNSFGDVWSGR
jgi:dTDP-4-dehydrorhamnose 3,5-epimerase